MDAGSRLKSDGLLVGGLELTAGGDPGEVDGFEGERGHACSYAAFAAGRASLDVITPYCQSPSSAYVSASPL